MCRQNTGKVKQSPPQLSKACHASLFSLLMRADVVYSILVNITFSIRCQWKE